MTYREPHVDFDFDAIDPVPADASPSLVDALELVRRVNSFIRAQDRSRLTVDCLFLALGDAEIEGETMTSVATKHGLTKAAISKRVKQIRLQLHLSINCNNKSPAASKRYAQSNYSPLRLDKS